MSDSQTPTHTTPTPSPPEFQLIYVHASPAVILSKEDSSRVTDKEGKTIKLGDNERACNIVMKIKYTRKIVADETQVPGYMASISIISDKPGVEIIEITDQGKKKVNMMGYKIDPLMLGMRTYKFPLLLYKNNNDEYVDYDNFVVNIQKITGNEITHEHSESFIIATK
jgi:hypothetical protein